MSTNPSLISPWHIIHREIIEFFKDDSDISISDIEAVDKEHFAIHITCQDYMKMIALNEIMKLNYEFGNVNLTIDIKFLTDEGTNDEGKKYADIASVAFRNNPMVNFVKALKDDAKVYHCFPVCKAKCIQFKTDNNCDLYGNTNKLVQDVCKDLFSEAPYMAYSTENLE